MSQGTLVGQLVQGIASVLGDIGTALGDSGQLQALVSDLGATLDQGATAAQVQALLGPLPNDLQQLATAAANLDPAAPAAQLAAATVEVVAAIAKVITDAHALAATTAPAGPAPFSDPAFWGRFFDDALALLAAGAVSQQFPGAFALLRLMGIAATGDPSSGQPLQAIQWQQIPQALGDPLAALTAAYDWGGQFAFVALLDAVADAAQATGLPVTVDDPAGIMTSTWNAAALSPDQIVPFLRVSLYRLVFAVGTTDPVFATIDIGIEVAPIPDATQQGAPVGIGAALDVVGSVSDQLVLAPGVTIQAQVSGDAAVAVELRPTGTQLAAPAGAQSALTLMAKPPQPWILGDPGSTRLEVSQVTLTGTADASTAASPEASVGIAVQGSAVLDLGAADGFLQAVFGTGPLATAINGSLTWSSVHGLQLMGGTGQVGSVPLAVNVAGILQLTRASAQLSPQGSGTQLTLGVTGAFSLGPITASVDTVGMSVTVQYVASGQPPGNLGPLDVTFGFSPPHGLGLALDTGPVSGTGFIAFDAVNARYLGAVALTVGDVGISAVGVLDTKLPGGAAEYSLIIVASADFPPVELGFGFSLVGIGGLVGINRTTDVPSLQALARAGQLGSLMFPADLAHRAPQVAASLEQVFPAAQGHFLVGPAVRIEWGTDGIVDAEVGVFIELTDSGGGLTLLRVALLGWVHLTLPTAVEPIADLTLDVLGVADLTAMTLSLDASLRKSSVAGMTLTGQAALRASWGSSPSFVFAIGGFNPHFAVPAGFPALQRLALSIGGDDPRLRLSAYLALTSNTVQFGCSADLYASAGPAAVAASLTFDALLQLKPFGLIVDLTNRRHRAAGWQPGPVAEPGSARERAPAVGRDRLGELPGGVLQLHRADQHHGRAVGGAAGGTDR